MSQAKAGDTVHVHYTGRLDNGTEFDSSAGREPLQFDVGGGQVIAGFESAVEGMTVGESKKVRIPAQEAYGPRNDELIQEVPREELPENIDPVVGMPLQARDAGGQTRNLVVTAVSEESITVDGNHPLAGQTLIFDLELVKIG